jgi:potassium/hydrogen antiporter
MQIFGAIVALVSGAVIAALLFGRVADRLRVPAPVVFLVVSAIGSDLVPALGDAVSPRAVGWIASGALIVILFNGGLGLGWRRVRRLIRPIAVLGFGATASAAAVMIGSAHLLVEGPWITAAVIGVALAPTDPAMVFSTLRNEQLDQDTQTILEAESGANDPVSIALMVGVLAVADGGTSWALTISTTLVRELVIGLVVGGVGAWFLRQPLKLLTEPSETLQPLVALAGAGLVFGIATAAHGSGFLAVFVAGIMIGDSETTITDEVRLFQNELGPLAELVVFVALGLTIHLAALDRTIILDGVVLTAILILIARAPFVLLALRPFAVSRSQRQFLAWAGLRGAVPILLASLALADHVTGSDEAYGLVFIVVALSVLIQGTTIAPLARRVGIAE